MQEVLIRERDLLAAIVRREEDAFPLLVQTYQDRLFSFVLRYTGRREDAEEVVQDALLKAYRALYERLTPERVLSLALTPWLYRITLNTARNRLRGRRLATSSLQGTDGTGTKEYGDIPDPNVGPEAGAETSALRMALAAELLRLPERYRVAVILRLIEGLSYEEIAAATRQPAGTVKSNVHRGLLAMRPGLVPWWRGTAEEKDNEL